MNELRFNTTIETPRLRELVDDYRTVSREVDTDKIDGVSILYSSTRAVQGICERIGKAIDGAEGAISETGLAAQVMGEEIPVLVAHRDGSYTAVSGHDYIEAFRAMGVDNFEAQVFPQSGFTEMRRVNKTEQGFRGSPRNWDAVMRATGERGSVVIPARDRFGNTYELYASFDIDGRSYEVRAGQDMQGIGVTPCSPSANCADVETRRADYQKMGLSLDSAQLKGKVVDRARTLLSH